MIDAAAYERASLSELGIPNWSVLVPTYNPTSLLRETLKSALTALSEAGTSFELRIVDDASTTVDVAALIRAWGMEFIPVHKRAFNGGLGRCWNDCIERAEGHLIHILHQDDLVRPSFYRRVEDLVTKFPGAGMYFCRTEFLVGEHFQLDRLEQEGDGFLENWLEKICAGQRLQCPAVVIPHSTYKEVGGYAVDLKYVIDWEMWVRIAAAKDVVYLSEALAVYRMHSLAETKRIKSSGATTRDFARAVRKIKVTLEARRRKDLLRSCKLYAVDSSLLASYAAEEASNFTAAQNEIRDLLRYFGHSMESRIFLRQLKRLFRLKYKDNCRGPVTEARKMLE